MRRLTDGRDIDPAVGILAGEGAQQRAGGSPDPYELAKAAPWGGLLEPDLDDPTYYDRPLLQESVWTWAIPAYYYVGGLTGAALALGAALQFSDAQGSGKTVQRCHVIGVAGTIVSGVLLVYDLGRPERFLNMLRVFRPTSPMNVGAWILTASGAGAAAAVALSGTPLGPVAGLFAGVWGLGLATYTGVLVGNTAVPLWSASRICLPILFGSSAMAAAGSAFDLIGHTRATRTFGNIGRICELATSFALEREASQVEYVARPLREGLSGFLWHTATALTGASLLLSLFAKRSKGTRLAAGVAGTLGSAILRFAIEQAGNKSARDPRATFRQQRA